MCFLRVVTDELLIDHVLPRAPYKSPMASSNVRANLGAEKRISLPTPRVLCVEPPGLASLFKPLAPRCTVRSTWAVSKPCVAGEW